MLTLVTGLNLHSRFDSETHWIAAANSFSMRFYLTSKATTSLTYMKLSDIMSLAGNGQRQPIRHILPAPLSRSFL